MKANGNHSDISFLLLLSASNAALRLDSILMAGMVGKVSLYIVPIFYLYIIKWIITSSDKFIHERFIAS